MKFFLTVTKKGLALTLATLSVLLITSVWTFTLKAETIDGSTHQKRMIFAQSLGLSVDEERISQKETVIPQVFGKVYTQYNQLQKRSGFNLEDFKGKTVTVYSMPLTDKNRVVTLIVFEGEIIGGDIADISVKGKMETLMYEKRKT